MGIGERSGDRFSKACFWALLAACFLLSLEAGTRLAGLDMLALRPLLYFQAADLPSHRAIDDPELLYGLKPDSRETYMSHLSDRPRTVTVNSLGFRDLPRQAAKPAGVFRVVCLGTSHMYGAQVDDAETLPRRLEEELARGFKGRFEVWNAGFSAYTVRQLSAAGRGIVGKYSPDLVLLAPWYSGRRAFLQDAPYAFLLRKYPGLYRENVPRIPFGDGRLGLGLLRASAAWRLGVFLWNGAHERGWEFDQAVGQGDMAELPRFVESVRNRTRVVLLDRCRETLPGLEVPGIRLFHSPSLPKDVPPEYYMTHPPAAVYRMQAEVVAQELGRLMPGVFRRKSPARPVAAPRGLEKEAVVILDDEVDTMLAELRFHRGYAKARALLERLMRKDPDKPFYRLRLEKLAAEEKSPPEPGEPAGL